MTGMQPLLKYGRRSPKNAPALRLSALLTGVIPGHPQTTDYLSRFSTWDMLGNDMAGDCVAVTWANQRRISTGYLTAAESYPTQDEVWAVYKTQNPTFDPNGSSTTNGPGSQADNGMDIQTLLEYLHNYGGPDGTKPVAFAKVDHTNIEEVKAAIAIFGMVWIGVNVNQNNMQEFNAGQPWDYDPNSPQDGGHSIVGGGYGITAASDIKFVTWAKETSFTDSFWANQAEECWVVIWPEILKTQQFLEGINVAALITDYKELTGNILPVPNPVPTPTPTPVPPSPQPTPQPVQPPAVDVKLAAEATKWEKSIWARLFQNQPLKQALDNWKADHGY